jgi:alpha-1,3-glucosyltransferase
VPVVETCISTADFTCPEPDPHPAGVAAMEFLPLMLTSVYCAVGLVWGFCRLMFVYLKEETTYQGPLSRI